MNTRVVTDSGSGLTLEKAKSLGIDLLPLQVTVDDKNYLDGIDLDVPTLYGFLKEGKMPTTSQPPVLMEEELFERYQKEGVTDIVLITLSNGLSSTNSVVQAAAARYDLKVHTLDLFTTLSIEMYAARAAQQLLEQGKTAGEVIEIIKEAIDDSAGYLIVESLDHLAAGGRLTPMAAKLGGLLKIKPILEVSRRTEGKVDIYEKVRTFNKAVKKAVERIRSELDSGKEYEFFVMNAQNQEGQDLAEELLKEAFGSEIVIHEQPLYAVIAAHTGLGSVGIQYIPKIEGVDVE